METLWPSGCRIQERQGAEHSAISRGSAQMTQSQCEPAVSLPILHRRLRELAQFAWTCGSIRVVWTQAVHGERLARSLFGVNARLVCSEEFVQWRPCADCLFSCTGRVVVSVLP